MKSYEICEISQHMLVTQKNFLESAFLKKSNIMSILFIYFCLILIL